MKATRRDHALIVIDLGGVRRNGAGARRASAPSVAQAALAVICCLNRITRTRAATALVSSKAEISE